MQSRGGQLRFIPPIGRSGCKRRREKRNAYWALSTVYDDIVNALCLARYCPSPETIGAKIIRHARRGYNPNEVRDIVLRELQAD